MLKKILIALLLNRLTALDKVAKAESIANLLEGNPDFPEAGNKIIHLRVTAEKLHTAHNKTQEAKKLWSALLYAEREVEFELEKAITSTAHYVADESKGDEAIIKRAGFEIKGANSSIGMPEKVISLSAKEGKKEGAVFLKWNSIKGARSYVVRQTTTIGDDKSWKQVALVTKASATIEGLQSGSSCWFDVAAIGAAGQGPWSDPSMKIVP